MLCLLSTIKTIIDPAQLSAQTTIMLAYSMTSSQAFSVNSF